ESIALISRVVSYPSFSGIGTVLIALVSYLLFKQKLDLPAIIGLILIITGVIVINLFSKSVSH
ncbi:MAG TPA: SMR family transporter, partial [Prolixibacteraceae bacterium]|nr:SMR family transporter [Prolixibacteraceae bacterium]